MVRMTVVVAALAVALLGLSGCGNATRTASAQDHIGQFTFRLEIDGLDLGTFHGVDGLDTEIEVIEFQDPRDLSIQKRPGRTTYSNITLKKGYINAPDLLNWWQRSVVGNPDRRNGSIILMDETGQDVSRYNFFEAWPCKWKGFSLDGKGDDVIVEEIELAIEKVEIG